MRPIGQQGSGKMKQKKTREITMKQKKNAQEGIWQTDLAGVRRGSSPARHQIAKKI